MVFPRGDGDDWTKMSLDKVRSRAERFFRAVADSYPAEGPLVIA